MSEFDVTEADKNGEPGSNRFNYYVERASHWHEEADRLKEENTKWREAIKEAYMILRDNIAFQVFTHNRLARILEKHGLKIDD